MKYSFKMQKLCHTEPKRLLLVLGIVAITHLLCQSVLLPYGTALMSLMADGEVPIRGKSSFLIRHSSEKSVVVGNSDLTDTLFVGKVEGSKKNEEREEPGDDDGTTRIEKSSESNFASEGRTLDNVVELFEDDQYIDDGFQHDNTLVLDESFKFGNNKDHENSSIPETTIKTRHGLSLEQVVKPNGEISADSFLEVDTSLTPGKVGSGDTAIQPPPLTSPPVASSINITILKKLGSDASSSVGSATLQSDLMASKNNSANPGNKKMRCDMPPKSVMLIDEMNHLFIRHRASSRSVV